MRRSHDGTFPMVEPYDIAGSANFSKQGRCDIDC